MGRSDSLRPVGTVIGALVSALCSAIPVSTVRQDPAVVPSASYEPLPLAAAFSLPSYLGAQLSSDGRWVAYTADVSTEGGYHSYVELLDTTTGKTVRPVSPEVQSADPSWSPDGQTLVFFSDAGGSPSLWVWDRLSGSARAVPNAGTPATRGEVRWFSDSSRLLVLLWPKEDERVSPHGARDAEAFHRLRAVGRRFAPVGAGEASVLVRRANLPDETSLNRETTAAVHRDTGCSQHYGRCHLALVDIKLGRIEVLVARIGPTAWFAPSPDGHSVAYTVRTGLAPHSLQILYDLVVLDVESKTRKTLVRALHSVHRGDTVSWSPDSRYLAYTNHGPLADGRIEVVAAAGGAPPKVLGGYGAPSFNAMPAGGNSSGIRADAPLWNDTSTALYAIAEAGELWEVDVASGQARVAASIPGQIVTKVLHAQGTGVVWSDDEGQTIGVMTAPGRDLKSGGLYKVDLRTRRHRRITDPSLGKVWGGVSGVSRGAAFAFKASSSASSLQAIWIADLKTGRIRRAVHSQHQLNDSALGLARVIDWRSSDGRNLSGALMLPPTYRKGQRLPLIVYVYGGELGSKAVNTFGFGVGGGWGMNPHIFSTRGYAVLYPDAPVRMGQPMKDIFDAVISGVDAAIAQGYADPERLAIMGGSFGSYSTLAVITQTPRFKAAVLVAVMEPNLMNLYLDGDLGAGQVVTGQVSIGGSPWEFPERYRDNSPIFLFDRIRTPVLIGHGELDPATGLHGADAVFNALQKLGKPVEYRVYEGEEHGLSKKANKVDFAERQLQFIAENLDIALSGSGVVLLENDGALSRRRQ